MIPPRASARWQRAPVQQIAKVAGRQPHIGGWRRAYSRRAVARLGCAIIAPSVNRFRLHLLVLVERRCPARPSEVATAASLLVGVVEGTRLRPMPACSTAARQAPATALAMSSWPFGGWAIEVLPPRVVRRSSVRNCWRMRRWSRSETALLLSKGRKSR